MRQLITLTFAMLVFACGGKDESTEPASPAPSTSTAPAAAPGKVAVYPTETVTIRTVNQPIRITGRVTPMQEATVASQVPGIVLPTDKLLQEGKYYRKGETMIHIDNEQLRLGLRADRSQLITAIVPLLSDLSIDYAAAYPAWEAFANAIKADAALPDLPKITDKQLGYYINSRGIPAQFYGIKAKEALLDDYTVRAPFSGRLTMASVDPGSYVQPGAPLARISRTDMYEVKASLPAVAVERVKVGQQLKLHTRNLGKTYTGTVNRFGTAIDPTTQTVTAYVRVSGAELRTGLYLETEIPGSSLEDVAVLPKEALTRDNTVYVIADGVVTKKAVEVALVESDKVYLRGLNAGDRVIVRTESEAIVGTRAK